MGPEVTIIDEWCVLEIVSQWGGAGWARTSSSDCIDFTRKRSDKHESQLNFELLRPFGIKTLPTLEEVNGMLRSFEAPDGRPQK